MDKWKIETDKMGEIHLIKNDEGSFINKEEAERLGRKIAKDNKAILFLHEDEETISQADYTSFLSPEEMYGKQISEVRITRAELAVAKIEMKKRKKALKNSEKEDLFENKMRFNYAKERLEKAKYTSKIAKRKFKEMSKSQKNSDY
ncbi:hypothetical protein ELUMI_v1c03570 [Williamsoniiplasma luminosum]|uniref:Uncharacterized protein n=1 Tax=Williamsoniiplasma luminosum TaxID=214888 RepID=A0A2K8NTB3_9MOLU|nr:hypothetical protein [Williamsoniiplasma luminosum]ATZ17082.1 hypothetical protein ELUMI_v1c03570 [Williamsoniiplasma luminosum]